MKTFEIDGKTYALNSKSELIAKVDVGIPEWGAHTWLPVKSAILVNKDITDPKMDFGSFPKVPLELILMVRKFFVEVYKVHKSEAFVFFHLDKETNVYTVFVPPTQSASAAHVEYNGNVRRFCKSCYIGTENETITVCPHCEASNFVEASVAGTAHSHGSMGAFHSGTDDAFELDQTGFHLTFGKVNVEQDFELAHSFVVAKPGFLDKDGKGIRFKQNMSVEEIIDIPFGHKSHFIHRWVTLVVSTPAMMTMKPDHKILVTSGQVISTVGCEDTYKRIIASLTGSDISSAKVCTKSEWEVIKAALEEEKRKEKLKTLGVSGSKQWIQQGGVVGNTTGGNGTTKPPTTHVQVKHGTTSPKYGQKTRTTIGFEHGATTSQVPSRPLFTQSMMKIHGKARSGDERVICVDEKGMLRLDGLSKTNDATFRCNFLTDSLFGFGLTPGEGAVVAKHILIQLLNTITDVVDGYKDAVLTSFTDELQTLENEAFSIFGEMSWFELDLVTNVLNVRNGTSIHDEVNSKIALMSIKDIVDDESTVDDILFNVLSHTFLVQELVWSVNFKKSIMLLQHEALASSLSDALENLCVHLAEYSTVPTSDVVSVDAKSTQFVS